MAKTLTFLLGLTLVAFASSAQSTDQLISKLDSVLDGPDRVDLLNQIVSTLREGNVYTAVKFGNEARQLAERLDYQPGLGLALENLGWIFYRRGIYSNAYDLSQKALKIQAELGDSLAIARCQNNVGAISYEKGEFDEAIQHFKNGYQLSWKKGDVETVVRSLNNVAFSYLGLNNIDSAKFYAMLALEKSHILRQGYLPAFSFRILGDIAFNSGDFGLARKYFDESLRISVETNNLFMQTSTMHRIGRLLVQRRNYDKALEVLHRNVTIAKQNGYADELERTYKLISDINAKKNNNALAYEFLQKHLAIHDSLIDQRNDEQMALLSAQFDSELQKSKIELLTQNSRIQEDALAYEKAWNSFYTICFVVGLALALVVYFSYLRIKKVNAQLEEKTRQVGDQADQLASMNQTKDKLLSIISHDIRSPLSSLRAMLNIVQSGNATKEEFAELTGKIGAQLDVVYEDLGNLLQWTQSQLQGLKVVPQKLDLRSLVLEVIQLFEATAKSKNIVIRNEVADSVKAFADPNHVRLILRNLVSNAVKFSQMNSEVIIRCGDNGELVNVSVCDFGIGLDENEKAKLFNSSAHLSKIGTANEKGMGVGLLLTKEFVEKNGGQIFVESELTKGSVFTFSLPRTA